MSAEATTVAKLPSALGIGIDRAKIEARVLARQRGIMIFQLAFWPAIVGLIASGQTGKIPGTNVSIAAFAAAGFIGAFIMQSGILRLAQGIAEDRQDGTFLRARSIGGGIESYLTGRVLFTLLLSVFVVILMLVVAHETADVPLPTDAFHWFTLVWVVVLGLFSCLMLGAALGGLLPNGKEATLIVMVPYVALVFISGVTTPASSYPDAVKIIAGIFPMRWMGQGIRSALLPDAAQTGEIGHQWARIDIFLVLAIWCVAGSVLAIYLLRRATLRESGSALEAKRLARGDG